MCGITEQSVIDLLIQVAKDGGVTAPRVVIADRVVQNKRGLTRTVKFALIIPTNEVLLIDKLIFEALDFSDDLSFVGSSVNLQSSEFEIDYVYFEATIRAIKTK